MAFFSPTAPVRHEYNFEDRTVWADQLSYYDAGSNLFNITKHYFINFFIKNFTKTKTIPDINIDILSWTRNDPETLIASALCANTIPNKIFIIKKTSISGRKISAIVNSVNEATGITMTELSNLSLYLQEDKTHPLRVFKITKENNITQYAVIGTQNIAQKVYYTCIGMACVWFPDLFKNLDSDRGAAIKELCLAIGKMEEEAYKNAIEQCFKLCYEPIEPEIDYTPIATLLTIDKTSRIQSLQNSVADWHSAIETTLKNYESYQNNLRRVQKELTELLLNTQDDKTDEKIKIAKEFKSLVDYTFENSVHVITIRSKMLIDSQTIVKKLLTPGNTQGQLHYGITTEKQRRLFEELFIDKTLQIDFCTTFHKKQDGVPYRITRPTKIKRTLNTIPNPHLIHYTCYGSNHKLLIEANRDNNLEYYLGVLTACNSNLNTGDATVLNRFCSDILNVYTNAEILYDVKENKYISPAERMQSYETV